MPTLDCETTESAYSSITEISGVSRSDIDQLLDKLDLEGYYKQTGALHNPEDVFVSEMQRFTGKDLSFDSTVWFHLTRTSPATSFADGIKPLGLCIDQIWDFLFSLLEDSFPKAEWEKFRARLQSQQLKQSNRCGGAHQYNLKVPDSRLWGPYAVLVRDIAFVHHEVGNHNYLGIPEIVEDICGCFDAEYDIDLAPVYQRHTVPCIVKFIDHSGDPEHIGIALCHLYCLYHGLGFCCSMSYDGHGRTVPAKDILKVDYNPRPTS